jgi:probable phosphoglycerate mutase
VSEGRIVVVRHGETEWSLSGRHTSFTDIPLSAAGREHAARLCKPLSEKRFALVLCSPMKRARDTCELAGYGDRAVLSAALREWNYGNYEGRTTPEIWATRPDWNLWRHGCPGGEQPAEVAARVDAVIARCTRSGGDALVFAHGHALRVLTARWIGGDAVLGARLTLGAGAYAVLGHERTARVIEQWNLAP